MIEFRGVTKRFPDGTVAVDNLDLVVEAGGITVFVGPSGCGKTTSLRMINRMIEPTEGTIMVDGRDVAATDAAELRRGIGVDAYQGWLFSRPVRSAAVRDILARGRLATPAAAGRASRV